MKTTTKATRTAAGSRAPRKLTGAHRRVLDALPRDKRYLPVSMLLAHPEDQQALEELVSLGLAESHHNLYYGEPDYAITPLGLRTIRTKK